jgi:hypothetical protein
MKSDVFSELGVEPLEQSLFSDSSSVMTSSGQANAVDYGFIENLNQMLESDSASQYALQRLLISLEKLLMAIKQNITH